MRNFEGHGKLHRNEETLNIPPRHPRSQLDIRNRLRKRKLQMRRRRSRARSGGEKSRFRHGRLLSSASVWSVSAEKVSFRPSTRSFETKRRGSQEAHQKTRRKKRNRRRKRRLGKGLPQIHRRCNLPLRGFSKTPFRLRPFREICEESRLH